MLKKYSIFFVIIVLIILPYWLAYHFRGEEIYSGLLFNPIDGFSYLAKMREGWNGNWLFVLPYSFDQGAGAYIFSFYLFLGHLARITHLSLVNMFHFARISGSVFLIWSILFFLKKVFIYRDRQIIEGAVLCSLGSGLGWIALVSGKITPDFWLAEAYPFLSMFANPHFPIGLGILLQIFGRIDDPCGKRNYLCLMTLGLLLSVILPFGFVIAVFVLILKAIWEILEKQTVSYGNIVAAMGVGGIWLIYQYYAILSDPVLTIWNEQNITLSPPVLDLLIAISPAVVIGIVGLVGLIQNREISGRRLVISWMVGCCILAMLPFGLQRRFLTGIFIPVCILAMFGLEMLRNRWNWAQKWAYPGLFILSIPTSLLIVIMFLQAGLAHDPRLFISQSEASAFTWMDKNLPDGPLILSSPETGLLLPVYSNDRVVYGHPFETIHADLEKESVLEFFSGQLSFEDEMNYLKNKKIDYIFYGPREKALSTNLIFDNETIIYTNDDVDIYQVTR
jgi:hypothetical protein